MCAAGAVVSASAAVRSAPGTVRTGVLEGRVTGVSDGDTLTLLIIGQRTVKVRLAEIDAPENGQPFGARSKRMLSDLVFGRTVSVRLGGADRYGRAIGRVRVNGTDVNLKLVREGGAWAYRAYLSDQTFLVAERTARAERRGLWALQPSQIMAPWDWRRRAVANPRVVSVTRVSPAPSCGAKRLCRQMASCSEAVFYLRQCGLARLDGDGDGKPCEKICG